jgi:hypothetical protein
MPSQACGFTSTTFSSGGLPGQWLIPKRIAFNEQYLLEGFLAFNAASR